jgi:hypothetical protein
MLSEKQAEFLKKLADLCAQYNAGFTYTNDDNGTHVLVDGQDIFAAHLEIDAADEIRKALS